MFPRQLAYNTAHTGSGLVTLITRAATGETIAPKRFGGHLGMRDRIDHRDKPQWPRPSARIAQQAARGFSCRYARRLARALARGD